MTEPLLPRWTLVPLVPIFSCVFLAVQNPGIQSNLLQMKNGCITTINDWKIEQKYRIDLSRDPDDVFVCDKYGYFLHKHGRLHEAERLYRAVIAERQKRGETNSLIATPMKGLALVYEDQGRFSEAEDLLMQVMQIRKKFDSKESLNLGLAEGENYLGWLYWRQSQISKAENCFKKSLSYCNHMTGDNGMAVVSAKLELADFYTDQRRYAEASDMYQGALDIEKTKLCADDSAVQATLSKIANLKQNLIN